MATGMTSRLPVDWKQFQPAPANDGDGFCLIDTISQEPGVTYRKLAD